MNREELLAKIQQTDDKEKLATLIESYADSRVTEGIKSYQQNQDKKNMNDQDRIQELENEIKELKQTLSKNDIDTLIRNELKNQNLSEDLRKYIKLDDVDNADKEAIGKAVEKEVTGLKNQLLKLSQEQIDNKLKGITPPVKGDTPGAGGNDDLVKNYVESKNTGKNAGVPFQGKFKKQGE
jgi:hypothetical protein